MIATGTIERRKDGTYQLLGRQLAPMDVVEVDVPTIGWRRGRFAIVRTAAGDRPVVTFINGQWIDVFAYPVDARWLEPSL